MFAASCQLMGNEHENTLIKYIFVPPNDLRYVVSITFVESSVYKMFFDLSLVNTIALDLSSKNCYIVLTELGRLCRVIERDGDYLLEIPIDD